MTDTSSAMSVVSQSQKISRVALVGLPWFWAHMPSIQLAIVKDILAQCDVSSDVYEFYVDFAELIGTDMYDRIANIGPFIGERLFSQFYFDELREQSADSVPDLLFDELAIEEAVLEFGTPLVDDFLDRCVNETEWSQYDVIFLNITVHQVGASLAFARRLRRSGISAKIVLGGAGCAGEMGTALLEIGAEFDIAVHGEAETTLAGLLDAMRGKIGLEEVCGISWRNASGSIETSEAPAVHRFNRSRGPLNFDAYFERVKDFVNIDKENLWVPFESSRGCWYGEKSQCTFCGLNEIIKYRHRETDEVFEELCHYDKVYGSSAFLLST